MAEKIEWQQMFSAEEIAKRVMEYNAGCKEGKTQFLKDQFGITEIPIITKKQRMTLEFEFDTELCDLSSHTLARVVANGFIAEQQNYLEGYGASDNAWWATYLPMNVMVRDEEGEEYDFTLTSDNITNFNRYHTP